VPSKRAFSKRQANDSGVCRIYESGEDEVIGEPKAVRKCAGRRPGRQSSIGRRERIGVVNGF
jgi:hypothetical protein